jgi:signal transduction histidine kinase
LAGFGGLIVLMALAGGDALVVLRQVRTQNAEIRKTYLARNRALEQIRMGIYLSGTAVRDYLLASSFSEAEQQRAKFAKIRKQTDVVLQAYAQKLDAQEASAFRNLQAEIQTYWRVSEMIFDPNLEEARERGTAYFYNQLTLRRNAMFELADRISAMNDRELAAGDEKAAEIFDRFRLRQVVMFLISVTGGLVLAGITILFMLRLEAQARTRYDESVRAQTELKELSAKLVAAQENERRAISRELHDEVGQALSALLMEAGSAAAVTPLEAEDLRHRLESIKELAEGCVNVLRNMALLLRPSMLDDLGLVPALRWQAREVAKRTGLKVRMAADGVPDDLPDEHKTCIFRVVQEALNNCARHAQARAVRVQVQGEAGKIVVRIQDDGTGFDVKQVRGLGLLGMEERINHVGGKFKVESEPGKGTQLIAELPVPGAARPERAPELVHSTS